MTDKTTEDCLHGYVMKGYLQRSLAFYPVAWRSVGVVHVLLVDPLIALTVNDWQAGQQGEKRNKN